MQSEKIAVVGTGGSAEKFFSMYGKEQWEFTFFNSSGVGYFKGLPVSTILSLKADEYDRVVLAVYDYGEILPSIEHLEKSHLYWFDATNSSLEELKDPYFDNIQATRNENEVLTVIYDMRVAPPTFDFVVFLVKSKLVADKRGLKYLKVIIAPGDRQGFRESIDFFSYEEMLFRVTHLFLPLLKLVDKNADLFLCSSRFEARKLFMSALHNFPEIHNFVQPVSRHHYSEFFGSISQGIEHRLIKPSEIYRKRVNEWMASHKITASKCITITLRESMAHETRNSQLEIWEQVARTLNKDGLHVVVVRDTSKALLPLGWIGVQEFPVAAYDVEMRAALYEKSWLNLGIGSGPLTLCMLMEHCNYILFKLYDPFCSSNTYEHLEKIGFVKGEDKVVGAGEGQYICWDDVTTENILSAIEQKFGVTIQ